MSQVLCERQLGKSVKVYLDNHDPRKHYLAGYIERWWGSFHLLTLVVAVMLAVWLPGWVWLSLLSYGVVTGAALLARFVV